MKYLSLFSGIEAASVAWEPLGWEPMAFAEFEAFPSEVLAYHFPATPNLGDVTAVDWEQWLAENGRPDVMVAGSPCQAFSVAGQRRSLQDARGNLALFTAELVRYLNPRVYVWENVPGVLSTKDNAFGSLLGELSGAGAALVPPGNAKWGNAGMVVGPERRLAWRVLDAQWFGVAQRRRRVFLVACPLDGPDPQQILFEPEGVRRNTPPSREPREGVATATESGFGSSSGVTSLTTEQTPKFATELAQTVTKGSPSGGGQPQCVMYPTVIDRAAYNQGENAAYDPYIAQTEVMPSLVSRGPHAVQPTVMAPAFSKRPGQQIANRSDGLSYAVTTGAPPSVLPEPTMLASGCANAERTEGFSPTLTTLHDGPPIVTAPSVRRLMPVECERLMGFPDGWTEIPWRGKEPENCPDGPRYKALGNSIVTNVLLWLGKRIERELIRSDNG